MKTDDKIRDRKIQYDINRKAALSSSVMNVLWEKKYYLLIKAE